MVSPLEIASESITTLWGALWKHCWRRGQRCLAHFAPVCCHWPRHRAQALLHFGPHFEPRAQNRLLVGTLMSSITCSGKKSVQVGVGWCQWQEGSQGRCLDFFPRKTASPVIPPPSPWVSKNGSKLAAKTPCFPTYCEETWLRRDIFFWPPMFDQPAVCCLSLCASVQRQVSRSLSDSLRIAQKNMSKLDGIDRIFEPFASLMHWKKWIELSRVTSRYAPPMDAEKAAKFYKVGLGPELEKSPQLLSWQDSQSWKHMFWTN